MIVCRTEWKERAALGLWAAMGVVGFCLLAMAYPAAAEDTRILGGEQVTVGRLDCLKLVKHVPAPDVAYRPGVDVRGKPVVPADPEGVGKIVPPENFTIDITVRIDKRFGVPPTAELYRPEARIGAVTVEGDKAYFNGQPLATESVNELAEVCRRLIKEKTE